MPYTPVATDATRPADSDDVSVAALEMRTIKAYLQSLTSSTKLQYCGVAGGTANAITLTAPIVVTAWQAGQLYTFKALTTNTGAATVAVSALGTIPVQVNGAALTGNEIVAGQYYSVIVQEGAASADLVNVSTSFESAQANIIFTASGTWTKPSWLLPTDVIEVEAWGGGGGGATFVGGGGGAYASRRFLASELGATETVLVAAAGAAGGVGGTSTFSSTKVVAYGGHTGGGGGLKSAATSTTSGDGYGQLGTHTANPGLPGGVDAGGASASTAVSGLGGTGYYGGGGGGGDTSGGGGNSLYGGAGGGTTAGVSIYGGNGGNNTNRNGSAPGGGGYGAGGTGYAGSRGEVRVRILS